MSAIPSAATQYAPAIPDYSHDQYLRKYKLTLGAISGGGSMVLTTEEQGYDLRMTFKVRAADAAAPNTAIITVYNLATQTAAQAVKEFNTVTLEAGYLTGNYGVIFQGSIKMYKRGRESAIDTYLIIYGADGDLAHIKANLNTTLGPNSTYDDRLAAIYQAQQAAQGDLSVFKGPITGGTLYRPRPMWGQAAMETRILERSAGQSLSIQNGVAQNVDQRGYLPGTIVVLNVNTGLIGVPEATQDGINATCLLNPAIRIRGLVQIDNASTNQAGVLEYANVTQYNIPGGGPAQGVQFPNYASGAGVYYASVAADGQYMVRVIDYDGDTRNLPWYCHLICWSLDPTQQPNGAGGNVQIGTPGGG
jgi:hypothetical protein